MGAWVLSFARSAGKQSASRQPRQLRVEYPKALRNDYASRRPKRDAGRIQFARIFSNKSRTGEQLDCLHGPLQLTL